MSITLATGTRIAIGGTLGNAIPFTAASNAAAAVLDLDNDPTVFAVNSIAEVLTSGWDFMQGVVRRVSAQTTSAITLEGMNTASTSRFPAGEGPGTVRLVGSWTSIPLIRDATIEGGEQQFVDTPELAKFVTGRLPSERSGIVIQMPVYFESTPGSGVAAAIAAQLAGTPVPIRVTHPSGDIIYASGYWSVRRMPSLTRGAARESQIECALLAVDEGFYAS